MRFERFEDSGLAHYSYAVGCPAAGEMAVVDPRRDVDVYLDYAESHDLRVTHVLETHIHADYASGARELARGADAELWVSAYDDGEDYRVAFEHRDMNEGASVELGSVRLEALHTPGHTPEHLSFLVYDRERSEEVPELMLSGDFLFVGSVGRPDLLGEEATRELASRMYDSVREKLAPLPDGLEVHPAHGSGSMCGSGMGGRPSSTLGFERIANPYLDPGLSREEFVERLVGSVPPFPDYYRRMKEVNARGPELLEGLPGDEAIRAARFKELVDGGHVVIDLRDQLAFGGGHVPGAYGIGAGTDLSTWAAWVVPYDRPLLLIPPGGGDVESSIRALVRVGLDDVRGWLRGGMEAWMHAGYPVAELPQVSATELYERLRDGRAIEVVDVRTDEEWRAGHIAGARHVMGGTLPERTDAVPGGDRTVAVVCGGGYRSTVAASVLERAGRRNLVNVSGGMSAWKRAGLPVEEG